MQPCEHVDMNDEKSACTRFMDVWLYESLPLVRIVGLGWVCVGSKIKLLTTSCHFQTQISSLYL